MRAFWRGIAFKWMTFSILLAILPLSVAAVKIVLSYQEDLKGSVITLQKEKATRVAERTRGYLEKTTGTLVYIAKDVPFLRMGMSYLIEDYFKQLLSQERDLIELALFDEKGFEKIRVSKYEREEVLRPRDRSMSPIFQTASTGRNYFGDYRYTPEGKPTMVIAVPVGEYRGRPVGVLKGRVNLEPLTDFIQKTRVGEKGSTYLIDHEGFLVAFPNEQSILLGPFVDWVLSGKGGNLEFEDLRGQRYLVVYEPIHELKWGVIVHIPVEEAYQPLREIARTAIQWILVAAAFAVVFSLILTRRFTFPIRRLSREMEKIARGDLDVQVEPSSKDEVGELSHAFNRMVADLKRSQEALREAERKYRTIFENSKDMIYISSKEGRFVDVNQAGVEMLGYSDKGELMEINIRECYQDPEDRKRFQDKVAEKGFVKDFEVRLKRKDGTPLDCLITATVRRDGGGEITGYEGIIKDISFRKQMEEELLLRTRELEALYDLGVLINQSLNLDLVFQIGLEKAISITGFELGTLHILSEDGETLELKHERGNPERILERIKRLKKGEGVCGTIAERGKPFLIDIDSYPTPSLIPLLTEYGIQTLAGIPLVSRERVIGAITLVSRHRRQLTPREVQLLEGIGRQIGMALENARLFSAIEKAKAEWETTFNTVTDLITIRDAEYRILRANRAAFVRWGMGPERMIGKRCYEILHQRFLPCEGCYVTETLRMGRPISGERESDYLKGVFQYYTYPVYDEAGKIVAVVDLAREITQEKEKEKEKEVINNIFKILASSLDIREVFKAVHTELKQILSTDRMTVTLLEEDGRGFRYFALDKDYEIEELKEGVVYPLEGTPIQKTAETGLPIMISNTEESEYWTSRKLAKEGIHSLLVYPLEYQGKIFGTLNFGARAIDHFSEGHLNLIQQIAPGLSISIQNSLLLDAIKGSEEKYRRVVEGAMDGVLIVGSDYRFKFVNGRLGEILGYTEAELIGMDFREVLAPESKALVEDRYLRRQRGEEVPHRYEFNVIRKDGAIRQVEISANLMKDPEGRLLTIAFLKDITEKKKMEEQLLQAEKLRALGEMASGVAHDFNNALASILGNTQLLLYTVEDKEVRESLKTIEKVAKDSAQTVKRLQEFTRRKGQEELFAVDVNAVVQDVIELTKPKWKDDAQKRGAKIEIHFQPGKVPSVLAHASEMREVITNIVLNALEAMPNGGKIEIQTLRKGDKVHIEIADSGIGMSEAIKKKIFEPFFTTKPFTNSGLGLSMSYGIIKRFGGEIEVESQEGLGTTFTITLPASEGGKVEKDQAFISPNHRSARILVIDDEETVRDVLSRMLTQFHHRVFVAKNGEEGIRLFKEDPFDMVLTDLGMPGISGWEVCRKIKMLNPSVPVGMITGWGHEIDEKKREEAGLDFVITKPFDLNQILHVLSERLR